MESKKINQLATELAPELSDLTIIGDPTTGISKKITLSQMASLFTGTVEEYANLASFPLVGTADTIYIALDTNIIYRWNTGTSAYVELSPNIVTSLVFSDANGFDGTISLVGSTATLTITTALTTGSVPFIGASGALSQDNANLFFDDTNNRLGINTNTPTTALDVFGSGIIGRLNGTSTNNAYLGFASAGSNKWSIGNVQSDHRFRIYNEATTSELVSVLQTGEFGIGIANPLTKLHIFGGASALIANLDTNTSVAKSISFRSGNSSRINLEVSGTESGSNAGMDFYLRAYTDAGALLSTPLTISRSTGAATFSSSITATGATFTSTQTNLVLNTTTNTSFTKLSFQENGSEKATITYPNSTFGAPTRREKLEISNLGGISFITQNAPLTPNMSITSAGNVGIGTSPSSIAKLDILLDATAVNGLQIRTSDAGSVDGSTTANVFRAVNSNAGNWANAKYNAWDHIFTTSGTTERMRITSGGNVGIGTSSPDRPLDIYSAATVGIARVRANNVNGAAITVQNDENSQSVSIYAAGSTAFGIGGWAGNTVIESGTGIVYSAYNGNHIFQSGVSGRTERMRITSGGEVIIAGTTSANTASGRGNFTIGGTSTSILNFVYGTTNSAYIYSSGSGADLNIVNTQTGGRLYCINNSGGVFLSTGATSWTANSDERLKDIIDNIENAVESLMTLRAVRHSWKSDINKAEHLSLIAQDVEKVFPQVIDKGKLSSKLDEEQIDETEYLGVRYTELIPVLVKAIQEQQAQIEELKALIK